ncbi:MAG: HD domain-containing protein [Candidatus Pacebacteria bacterium]|nr:HD domain-containing protein [Candidatus Paceibacterota bacterium]
MARRESVVIPFIMSDVAGEIVPPEDLRAVIEKLEGVQRFIQGDYPKGVIVDDTFSHELRCLGMARGLGERRAEFRDFDFDLLERIIWLHDLGELHLEHDVTAIEQARRQGAAEEKAETEWSVLSKLLSAPDLKLLEEVDRAGGVIKKGGGWADILPEAAVAYIIDKIDSNMCFHYWVSKSSQDFPQDSLTYTFNQYWSFVANLCTCPISSVLTMATELLDKQITFIAECWGTVPELQRPAAIREQSLLF